MGYDQPRITVFLDRIIGYLTLYGKNSAYFTLPSERKIPSSSRTGFKKAILLVCDSFFPHLMLHYVLTEAIMLSLTDDKVFYILNFTFG